VPLSTAVAWQAAFLLDAAPLVGSPLAQAPDGPSPNHPLTAHPRSWEEDRAGVPQEVAQACALLVAHAQPDLPLKFVEVRDTVAVEGIVKSHQLAVEAQGAMLLR
jgi:hypothetical protein